MSKLTEEEFAAVCEASKDRLIKLLDKDPAFKQKVISAFRKSDLNAVRELIIGSVMNFKD
jgi:hypothetical protein